MMGSRSAVVYLLGFLVLVNLASFALSACCGAGGFFRSGYCGDGTAPDHCCGRGPCNIFCCNCDGGCRGYRKRGTDHGEMSEKEVFANMDLNGDGFVDKAEADAYALKNLYSNHTEKLAAFDEGFKKLGKAKITLADLRR